MRKKLIGNDYVNIAWLENPYHEFDTGLIISGAILIYILVCPISSTHYLIKLKQNKRSKFNLMEKLNTYFTEEMCVSVENNNLSSYLIYLIVTLNFVINYTLQKTAFKKLENEKLDRSDSKSTLFINSLQSQISLDSNITQRYKEIERINNRFRNNI